MKVHKSRIIKLLAPHPNSDSAQPSLDTADSPTHQNIVNAMKLVPKRAKRGSMVYIHYSGHGARATTVFPTLKGKSGLDEALVPTDISRGGQYLRDLETMLLLKDIEEAELVVTVVLDCCHSGSATRGPRSGTARGITQIARSVAPTVRDEIRWPATNVANRVQKSWLLEPHGYTLLAACLPHQEAMELPTDDGQMHGALTNWLLDTLRHSADAALSAQMLYRHVCARIRNETANQTPIFAGESSRFFFGPQTIPPVFSLVVQEVYPDLMGTSRLDVGCRLELAGGTLHGVCLGAEYAIFPFTGSAGSSSELGSSLGRLIIIDVAPLKSIATLVEVNDAAGLIEPGCRAVLLDRPLEKKIRVRFVALDTQAMDAFRGYWDKRMRHNAWLHLASNEDHGGSVAFIIDSSPELYQIQDRNGVPVPNISLLLPPLHVGDPAAMPKLLGRVQHLAQFRMVKILENVDSTSALRGKFLFEVLGMAAAPNSGEMFNTLHGERIQVRFKNLARKPVTFVLFDLQPLFGITQIYPTFSDSEPLDPGDERIVSVNMSIPKQLLASLGNKASVVDTLKVFVTWEPTPFQTLQLTNIDEAERKGFSAGFRSANALQHILEKLARPQRDACTAQAVDEWQTVEISIRTSCAKP